MPSEPILTSKSKSLDKAFTIRRSILKLTGNQSNILKALNLASVTPRQWIEAFGRDLTGAFLIRRATEQEREFIRIIRQSQGILPKWMTIHQQHTEPVENDSLPGHPPKNPDWKNKLISSLEKALHAAKGDKARDALAWTVNAESEARRWFKQTIGSKRQRSSSPNSSGST